MIEITPEILEQIRLAQQQNKERPIKELLEKPTTEQIEPFAAEDSEDITVHIVKNDQGIVLQKIPMKEGNIHGVLEEFDDQGSRISEIMFDQGKRNGRSIFYIKGHKVVDVTFAQDVLEGSFATYHMNGKINTTGTYTRGAMDQELCIYDDQENLIKKEQYQAGYKEGVSQTFYPDGILYEEIVFGKDIPIGESKTYHINQTLMMLKRYKDGMIVYQETYDDKGNMIDKKSVD